jgi:hypothetical protein
MKVSV